jgi:hypothetical protein
MAERGHPDLLEIFVRQRREERRALGAAAKEVALIGAVIGREFSFELIDHVARRSRGR